MAGKPYTMREMKSIVEYLTERSAYSEIKGRKMWMEYANSDKTTRTWQSLKETFIKRILPDIQNPYYKLTLDQVRSFREGVWVVEKEKNNRLVFKCASDDISEDGSDEKNKKADDKETTNIDEELQKATGENITDTKKLHQTKPDETLLHGYENAEEIQRDLESPNNVENKKVKSLVDKLTFEHTAPIVRDVLADFASDSSDDLQINNENMPAVEITDSEPVIEIKEIHLDKLLPDKNVENKRDSPIEIYDSETTVSINSSDKDKQITRKDDSLQNKTFDSEQCRENQIEKSKEKGKNDISKSSNNFEEVNTKIVTTKPSAEIKANSQNSDVIVPTGTSAQNSISDSFLPNNQEALSHKKSDKLSQDKIDKHLPKYKFSMKKSQKRSVSFEGYRPIQVHKTTKEKRKQDKNHVVMSDNEKPFKTNVEKILKSTSDETSKKISNTINSKDGDSNVDVQYKNPCLQSVNLFEEQFNKTQYSDTDSDNAVEQTADEKKRIGKNKESDNITASKSTKAVANKLQAENSKQEDEGKQAKESRMREKQIEKSDINTAKSAESDKTSDEVTINKDGDVCQDESEGKEIEEPRRNIEVEKHPNECNLQTAPQKQDAQTETKEHNEDDNIWKADTDVISSSPVQEKDSVKGQREKAIANAFGFAHGSVVSSNRKRRLNYRRRSYHCHRRRDANSSSEWTSESESEEYVSPPNRRCTWRYGKPKRARVVKDPKEGDLYVIIGKHVFPLVRKNRNSMNYLRYESHDDSNEEEAYWKKKYIEQKQKAETVEKLLKDTLSNKEPAIDLTARSSSRERSSRNDEKNTKNKESDSTRDTETKSEPKKDEKLVLKIAAQNGLEYQLEGGWSLISTAMPQVVKMLQNDVAQLNRQAKMDEPRRAIAPVQSFRPIENQTEEAPRSVSRLESKIYEEIKELEENTENRNANVTERNANRPRTDSTASSSVVDVAKTPAKRRHISISSESNKETVSVQQDAAKNKPADVSAASENETTTVKNVEKVETPKAKRGRNKKETTNNEMKALERDAQPSRTSSRLSKQRDLDVSKNVSDDGSVASRAPRKRNLTKQAPEIPATNGPQTSKNNDSDDEKVRYMFPPEADKEIGKKAAKRIRRMPSIAILPPPEESSYQDTENSNVSRINYRRKRRASTTARSIISRRRSARVSLVRTSISSDSNNSCYFSPRKRLQFKPISGLDLAEVESESPQNTAQTHDQTVSPKKCEVRHFRSVSRDNDNSSIPNEMCNSSGSPNLSIVGNLSISRDMIKSDNHPTINETQQNGCSGPIEYTNYMISNVYVTNPLLDQLCEFDLLCDRHKDPIKSEAGKVGTPNATLSKSLVQGMGHLLLESARVISSSHNPTPMEVEQTPVSKKSKTRGRKIVDAALCGDQSQIVTSRPKKSTSTPQKKTVPKPKRVPDSIIEEEQMEFCHGKTSSPPVISAIQIDENSNDCPETGPDTSTFKKNKKDIMKVKIQRPGRKSDGKKKLEKKYKRPKTSLDIDSGINEVDNVSEASIDVSYDSKFVHNHSANCIMATKRMNESRGSSSGSSLTTVRSSQSPDDSDKIFDDAVMFSNGSISNRNVTVSSKELSRLFESKNGTMMSSSLITNDRSSETSSSTWQLVDEEDTSYPEPAGFGHGSNLRNLFPIACAVPNLSTISETSRENQDSRSQNLRK